MRTLYAQTPSSNTNAANARQLAEARDIFAGTCAGCHGLDGRGAERGPNIATRREVVLRSDADLFGILQKGIPNAGMPGFEELGNAKLQALVSYLRTLQGKSVTMSIIGNPKAGEVLFFGKAGCSECHMVSGRGGFIGSDLSAYASDSAPADIRHAIVKPERVAKFGHDQVQLTMVDGKRLEGVVRNEDNFSIQLQTPDGVFHFIQRPEISGINPLARPLMPEDYGQTLSSAELDDLVGFLMSVARSAPKKPPKKRTFDDE